MSKKLSAVMILATSLQLQGCYDTFKVNYYEAHQYKGKTDAHTSRSTCIDQGTLLSRRFYASQADR